MTRFLTWDTTADAASRPRFELTVPSSEGSASLLLPSREITMKIVSTRADEGYARSQFMADLKKASAKLIPLEPMVLTEAASDHFRSRMDKPTSENDKLRERVKKARDARR